MVVMSKLFNDVLQHRHCSNDFVHPHNCLPRAGIDIPLFILSNLKHFAPVVLVPLLVRIRSIHQKALKSTFKYYLDLVLFGFLTGYTTSLMICVFRNLLGKFKHSTFLFAPAIIGGLMNFIAPERVNQLFERSVFQCFIESHLIRRKNLLTKTIADSKFLQTWIFMCCSALILDAKQKHTFKGFWLLRPNQLAQTEKNTEKAKTADIQRDTASSVCQLHKSQTCAQYLGRGVRTYMAIGLTLDVVKMLMSSTKARNGFKIMLLAKLGNFEIRSTALLGAYIGIYRFAHCYLNRRFGGQAELNHLIASFLGGSCYMFYPKLTLLSYGVVLSIDVLWNAFKSRKPKERNEALEFIKRIPLAKILYPFALGYVVHVYCLRRHYVSGLADAIVNGLTNNYAKRINQHLECMEKILDAGI